MALHGEREFVRGNADAVVFDRDRAHTAGRQAHDDRRRTRVDRVVDQLAHDRRRALDDLARGDLVDQFVVQQRNGAARGAFHRQCTRT
jgi:hypothetical protein